MNSEDRGSVGTRAGGDALLNRVVDRGPQELSMPGATGSASGGDTGVPVG